MTRPKRHLYLSALLLATLWGCSSRNSGCDGTPRPIHDLQGPGTVSPLAGQQVAVRAVVVGDFQGEDRLGGFFVQEARADADPLTSEGLFVSSPNGPDVAVGDVVEIVGRIEERAGLTELTGVASIRICRSGEPLQPTPLSLSEADLEPYEGMLVSLEGEHTVAGTHLLGSAGQLLVARGGRLFHFTNSEAVKPTSEALRLPVDDGSRIENPAAPPFLGADGTRRVGDKVYDLTGVISQGEDGHVLVPTTSPRFASANPRPTAPPEVGGTSRIASFNLLNFFSTLGERGAADADELERQSAKHVAAIAALDADVVGLIELENAGDAALQFLVDALNAELGDATWAAVPAPAGGLGEDPIRVGLIYRPAVASPVGATVADHHPVFKRPPLAQTFQLRGERLTVVVSHLKSKRCGDAEGADEDAGDGQGCWNALRTQQARRLSELIGELQVASGDPDVLVLGDLNAYGAEDPIRTLIDGGLIDQVAAHVPPSERYSYVFSGASGYLDHALTTASLDQRVTGVAFWHINADEPPFLNYKTGTHPAELYRPNPYRSSDHDPVLIGLDL